MVDTTNFSTKSDFMGSHENLHLTEKFTRVSRDILNYEFTVDDPTTWTRPWPAMIPLALKNEMIFDYACHEAERSGSQHAARSSDRKARGLGQESDEQIGWPETISATRTRTAQLAPSEERA